MTDAVALGRRRPGGQPKSKDQKRIAMSLRLSPALHARLVARAKEHGRSITQQAEMLLDQALRDPGGIHVLHDEIIKALAEMRERIDQRLFRELDEREGQAFAQELKRKRKP
jgi:hypothetical protein